nr:LysR family transcriptional regulator substrate-binding protein [Agreia bicolorata]
MRVGITPWASSRFGDRVIETARAANLQVDVESDLSSTLLHHLQHGTLDLAVVHLPVDLPGVSTRPLGMYQFSILTEPDHALANLKSARLVDLADHKLLMLPLMMQPRAMQRVRESLAEAGVVSIVELDLKDVVNVRSRMRRNGEIMLGTLADDTPLARVMPIKDGAVVPLEPGELTLEIGLAWRTDREDRDKTFSALIASVEPAAGKPLEIVR